jgi:hypothetical protein
VITLLNAAPEDKIPAVANEAMVQGQFCVISGYDGDDALMNIADTTDDDELDTNKLYLVMEYAVRVEGTEHDDWDDIANQARVNRVAIKSGLLIEDNELATNVTGQGVTVTFALASPGALMILNTDGFLTLDGADDDPGAGATVIAKFKRIQNGIIFYEMVSDNVDS